MLVFDSIFTFCCSKFILDKSTFLAIESFLKLLGDPSQNERQLEQMATGQLEGEPVEQSDLHAQMARTLQSSRLLSYHMDMQMQELFNMFEFFDRPASIDDCEKNSFFFRFIN